MCFGAFAATGNEIFPGFSVRYVCKSILYLYAALILFQNSLCTFSSRCGASLRFKAFFGTRAWTHNASFRSRSGKTKRPKIGKPRARCKQNVLGNNALTFFLLILVLYRSLCYCQLLFRTHFLAERDFTFCKNLN